MDVTATHERRVPEHDELCRLGRRAGLAAVGVAPATALLETRRILRERKASGLHGGMQFTYRNPDRSTDPAALLRGARAIVVGAWPYARPDPPTPDGPRGRIARYARDDVYDPLRAALDEIGALLRAEGWATRRFADDNSLVDRAVAHRAGIGSYGKNANILLPGQGSWFVLGAVVTDAPLAASDAPVDDQCGSCRRCLDGCPTGAIVAPGVVDARRCLAWLVQAGGTFPLEYREALGDRFYGCDDCQEVCPPNRRGPASSPGSPLASPASPAEAGESGEAGATFVDPVALLDASDEELFARFGRWYVAGRDPNVWRRNLLVVLANTGDPNDPPVLDAVARYRRHPDPVLREHADWAWGRLSRQHDGT